MKSPAELGEGNFPGFTTVAKGHQVWTNARTQIIIQESNISLACQGACLKLDLSIHLVQVAWHDSAGVCGCSAF